MKVRNVLLTASLVGAVSIIGLSQTTFAWHPKGVITKKVQNITTGSALSEADTEGDAVAAKPGDKLKYVITVSNIAAPAEKAYNDMTNTVMTDTLPDGVALESNPSMRSLRADLGRIKPGESKTKEYIVVVTSKEDQTIKNTACFTGNTEVNDNPQSGCNPAVVTVTVPETPVTPTTPEKPETPVKEKPAPVVKELPHTGMAENALISALGLGLIVYVAYAYVTSRRELAKNI